MSPIQTVRSTLSQLIKQHHTVSMYPAVGLRLKLMDACPDSAREIAALMQVYKSDTISEMLRLRQNLTRSVLLPKLVRWLARDAVITEEDANWIVNSWAIAFGIIPFVDEALTTDDKIKKPAILPDKVRLEGHTKFVTSVTFNAQGTHLASSSWDGTVHLWDVNNLSNHRIFAPHTHIIQLNKEVMIHGVAFDAAGGLIAAANSDGTICLLNSLDGSEIATLRGHLRSVNRITFGRDNYLLASCGRDYSVCLWDLEQGQNPLWCKEFEYLAECVAISPDGNLVALATKGVDIQLLDITSGETVRVLKGHSVTVRGVAFTTDGGTLVSASGDGTVRLWNVNSGQQTRLLNIDKPAVQLDEGSEEDNVAKLSCVAVSPDGQYIAAGDFDERIYIWLVAGNDSQPFVELHGHAGVISSVAFSPDGKWMASSSWDQTICLWDILTLPSLWVIRQASTLLPSPIDELTSPEVESSLRDSARPLQQLSDKGWQLLLREVLTDSLLHFLWYMKDLKLAKNVMRNMSLRAADMLTDDLIMKFQGCDPDKLKADDIRLKRGRESITEFIFVLNRLNDEGQI